MMTRFLRRASLAAALLVAAVAPLFVTSARAAETKPAANATAATAPKTQDQLIMKSGTVVKGQIIEESASSVTIMVEFPGMAPVKTSYPKTDIVDIKRKLPVTGAPVDAPKKDADKAKDDLKDKQAPTASDEDSAAKLMVLKLEGRMGWDLTTTPFKEMFEAIDKEFNDLDESGRVKEQFRKSHIVVLKMETGTDPRRGFDGFFVAEKFVPAFEAQMEKGRRFIVWVDELTGGGGFFPLLFPEIYWTKEGRIRGTGDLDKFDIGDKMVNEKQISLRLGHAEGIAIKGGYAEVGVAIIHALSRGQNWLAVRMEGGKPVILERQPKAEDGEFNWTILKDNGLGDNKDKMETRGNDHLVLEADWARNLGISKGTCDTEEDLAFALGAEIARNYKVIEKPKAQKVLEDWTKAIDAAWELADPRPSQERMGQPGKLWRELAEVRVDGDFAARTKAQSKKLNLIKSIRSLFERYAEAWDPEGQFRSRLDIQKTEIEQEIDRDRKAQRRQG